MHFSKYLKVGAGFSLMAVFVVFTQCTVEDPPPARSVSPTPLDGPPSSSSDASSTIRDKTPIAQKAPTTQSSHVQCDLAKSCDRVVGNGSGVLDVIGGVSPGDVICIRPGVYSYGYFRGIVGTQENPITIRNCGGQVSFSTDTNSGIVFVKSRHFSLVGNGDPTLLYGIEVLGAAPGQQGVAVGDLSRDFELAYLKIRNPLGFTGIMAKTDASDPVDLETGQTFVQTNTHIHHNLIEQTGTGEGMYIGYFGCNAANDRKARLKGVKIHDNILNNIAADGIQVGCANEDVEIYRNKISRVGISPFDPQYHSNGIQIGAGSIANIWDNFISSVPENCVILGGGAPHPSKRFAIRIFNNVMESCGQHVVYLHSLIAENYDASSSQIIFAHNTVVNKVHNGVHGIIGVGYGLGNLIDFQLVNNIIHPLNANEELLTGETAGSGFVVSNNVVNPNFSAFLFRDPPKGDYSILDGSPAVGAGIDLGYADIFYDIRGERRGPIFDAGAYQLQASPCDFSTDLNCSCVHPFDSTARIPGGQTISSYVSATGGENQCLAGLVVDSLCDGDTQTLTPSAGSFASCSERRDFQWFERSSCQGVNCCNSFLKTMDTRVCGGDKLCSDWISKNGSVSCQEQITRKWYSVPDGQSSRICEGEGCCASFLRSTDQRTCSASGCGPWASGGSDSSAGATQCFENVSKFGYKSSECKRDHPGNGYTIGRNCCVDYSNNGGHSITCTNGVCTSNFNFSECRERRAQHWYSRVWTDGSCLNHVSSTAQSVCNETNCPQVEYRYSSCTEQKMSYVSPGPTWKCEFTKKVNRVFGGDGTPSSWSGGHDTCLQQANSPYYYRVTSCRGRGCCSLYRARGVQVCRGGSCSNSQAPDSIHVHTTCLEDTRGPIGPDDGPDGVCINEPCI